MARVTSPVLIGRVEELASLKAALEQVDVEGARVVLLGGEAGVGKSRLVREFLRGAGDARVLMGGSVAIAGPSLPYAPIADALRRLLGQTEEARWPALLGWTRRELAVLLPETLQGGAPGPEETDAAGGQGRLFGAVLGLLDRLARDRPTVLVVEDLQWADRSTLDLVAYLAHGMDRERVLLLLTFRSDELSALQPPRSLLARLEQQERVDRIDLGGLDPAEVLRLVEAIRGHQPDRAFVDDLVARSEGNPLFVE
jgi:predicted ATPase